MAPSDKPVAAMTSPDILGLPLDRISVGPGRHRRDMGDLQALADSMSEIGLLQPIGVTADFALVFGERRLRAARILGWTAISARIVDVPSIVAGEYAENEVRKDFTPSERVAIAEALRARIGERRGRPAGGKGGLRSTIFRQDARPDRRARRASPRARSTSAPRPSSSTVLPWWSRRWTAARSRSVPPPGQ